MSDLRPPMCKNPDHPPGETRDCMRCAEEPTESIPFYVFWCPTCAEVKKIKSVQVLTAARFRAETRKRMAAEGRLLRSAPPTIRRTSFDNSLREKAGLK